jgi:hypothetical protein
MPVRSRTCEDAKALRTPRNTLVSGADTRNRVDSTRTCVLRCRGSGTVSDGSGRRCHLPEQAFNPLKAKVALTTKADVARRFPIRSPSTPANIRVSRHARAQRPCDSP